MNITSPAYHQGAKDLNSRGADFEAGASNVEIPDGNATFKHRELEWAAISGSNHGPATTFSGGPTRRVTVEPVSRLA
jgi:hypothetical protein